VTVQRADWRDHLALAVLIALELIAFFAAFRAHGIF
jgi:hypothetical protein